MSNRQAMSGSLTPPDSDAASVRLMTHISDFLDAFSDPRPLGVAISGGSDSTGLVAALHEIAGPARLVALTVDHGLRSGSAEEAVAVAEFCKTRDIRHETLRWTGDKPTHGIQAAARAARQRLLADAARRLGLSAVATAHTKDDQRETRIMRGRRSLAPDSPGLAGIPPATLIDGDVWIVRPLLGIARSDIRAYLAHHGLGFIDDPSNEDVRFERVRVRRAGGEAPFYAGDAVAARLARARATAGLLISRAAYDGAAFQFDADGLDADDLRACLEVLIDVAGGRGRAMDRHGRARLSEFASTGKRLALGRAEIERSGSHFIVRRERRDLGPIRIGPGGEAVWDGRFRIGNRDPASELCIAPGGERGTAPVIWRGTGGDACAFAARDEEAGGFTITPVCGRAGRILPVHELNVANAVARLMGRPDFPDCPWTASLEAATI